jgi:hypothetical protein
MANINTLTLSNVVHSFQTALNYSRVTNHDAALLILHKLGGTATSKEIKKHLQAWRGPETRMASKNPMWCSHPELPLAFTYLFNTSQSGGYGFVGKDVNSVSNKVWHDPAVYNGKGCYTQRRTFWYRVKRGTYALTTEGLRRLGELEAQLS